MILGLLEGISGQKKKDFHLSSYVTPRSILVDINPLVSRIQHEPQTKIAEKTFLKVFKIATKYVKTNRFQIVFKRCF